LNAAADALKAAVFDAETVDDGSVKNARLMRMAVAASPEMTAATVELVKRFSDVVVAYVTETGSLPPVCPALAATAVGVSALQMAGGLNDHEATELLVALARARA
jgi:hypothetical protein